MSYVLRYEFDLGSGICLWVKKSEGNEGFGYPFDTCDY